MKVHFMLFPKRFPLCLSAFLLTVVLFVGNFSALPAGAAQAGPDRPLLCFMVQGSANRTLTLVPSDRDRASGYQVATDLKPAEGSFTLVKTFPVGKALNAKVASKAHWVRAQNNTGVSSWIRCDNYRRTASVSVEKLVDYSNRAASVVVGLDGRGSSPYTSSYRSFTGTNDDIVVVNVAGRAGLAPNGKKMAWRSKFRLAEEQVNQLKDAGNGELSWNVMQRGLASDAGGQWKMSLVSKANDKIKVQCVTQDGRAGGIDRQSVESVVDIGALKIRNGYTPWITATCFSDDSGRHRSNGLTGDGLQVVVNGRASVKKVFPEGIGELIAPSSKGTCVRGIPLATDLFAGGIGNVFTIGNKPFCNGSSLGDDRFVGQIDSAQVFKQ